MRAAYVTVISKLELKITLIGGSGGDITRTVHSWDKAEEVLRNWLEGGLVI